MNVIVDQYSQYSWLEPISFPDHFDNMFRTDESIMEIITIDEIPWDDYHHSSSFLPNFTKIENEFSTMFSLDIVDNPESAILIFEAKYESNLGKISTTILVNILVRLGIMKDIHIGASCSLE